MSSIRLTLLLALLAAIALVAAASAFAYDRANQDEASPAGLLSSAVSFVGFNTDDPPLDDPAFRRALVHAIDKALLMSFLPAEYTASKTLTNRVLPPGSLGHDPSLQGLTHDKTLAAQRLDESTYADPLTRPPLMYQYPTADIYDLIVPILQVTWSDGLGLELDSTAYDFDTFVGLLVSGPPHGAFPVLDVPADYSDTQTFLDDFFYTEAVSNFTGYSNSIVDDLLDQARVEADEATRADLYRQVEEILVTDAVWLPLWWDTSDVTPIPTPIASPTHTVTPSTPQPTVPSTPTPVSTATSVVPTGDVDCGGSVTAIDSALILQLVAGLIDLLSCPDVADVSGDGLVGPVDSALILQFVAGLILALSV